MLDKSGSNHDRSKTKNLLSVTLIVLGVLGLIVISLGWGAFLLWVAVRVVSGMLSIVSH